MFSQVARRPSPKLRTKTGCFMCRKRRKKCDEVKPLCSNCQRLNFECIWPAPLIVPKSSTEIAILNLSSTATTTITLSTPSPSQLDATYTPLPFSDDSTKIGLARSAVYGLPGVKTSAEHYLSLYFKERFMPLLLRHNAHPAFGEYSLLLILGLEESTAMTVFFALAAMHASCRNRKFRPMAVRYYNSIVTSLARAIDERRVQGDESWLLVTANFMCLFEVISQRGNAIGTSAISTHLEGVARILNLRLAKYLRNPGASIQLYDRIIAEAFVNHISTMNLFYANIDRVGGLIRWEELSIILDHENFPGTPNYANSPILEFSWKLYRTKFEVTRLSHMDQLDAKAYTKAQALEADLLQEEQKVKQEIEESKLVAAYNLLQQTLLHIFASQILIFKVLRPETRTWHPRIKELVGRALQIIEDQPIAHQCSPYIQWPVTVVSCAITEEEEMLSMRQTLQKMWDNSSCGEVSRARKALETFWQALIIERRGGDLLDVLINREGLFNHPYLDVEQ